MKKQVDIIIIGSGMSGLYSAYQIKKYSPETTFLILEKYKKKWLGGRTNNEMFYGTRIVTGAGIGRKDTNPLLIQLLKELHISYKQCKSIMEYSSTFSPIDIEKVINKLKSVYKKYPQFHGDTFKEFTTKILGEDIYNRFIMSAGYTDYEDADVYETLYNYGMDDNKGGWTGLFIPWKELVEHLYIKIGKQHFKFSSDVIQINKIQENPCLFEVKTKEEDTYYANKVIVATTISGIKELVPHAKDPNSLYQQIHGQPFLRLYAKFDNISTEIMKNAVKHYTIVPGPLQKIIPMNSEKGVYMIAYSDNQNALALKDNKENNQMNRSYFCRLIEQALGLPHGCLKIISLKDFYWPIGTHYFEPLKNISSRKEFLNRVQHPEKGMLVVGEAVSTYQGWVEGALESVKAVVTKDWVKKEC